MGELIPNISIDWGGLQYWASQIWGEISHVQIGGVPVIAILAFVLIVVIIWKVAKK